MHFIKQWRCSL